LIQVIDYFFRVCYTFVMTETVTTKATTADYTFAEEASTSITIDDIFTEAGKFYGKWHICARCGEEFPETELALIGGKYFCYKYKDAQDELASRSKK